MIRETPKELFEKGLITPEQFTKINRLISGELVSVFYELRSLLYLGVMLFTTGTGILIYQNIGDLGHVVSIIALSLLTLLCFWYGFTRTAAYSNKPVASPTPYFDYTVLLGCLLFISVQGYLQFQYGWLDENLGIMTLVTALLFFFIAYRFDHIGILSLAITALASFWSISISSHKWYTGKFLDSPELYITAIIFGSVVIILAILLDRRSIKPHFTFTYLNFCLLIFFIGSLTGLFTSTWYGIYILLIYAGCVAAYYTARMKFSFLFLLYAFIAAYIATTYLLVQTIVVDDFGLWSFYTLLSCGGFVYFIVRYRNHFRQQP